MKAEKYYNYWLANIDGISNITINHLLEIYKTPAAIYHADEKSLCKNKGIGRVKASNIEKSKRNTNNYLKFKKWESSGIKAIFKHEKGYPECFKVLYDAPFAIYYKGRFPDMNMPGISIVGARGCSNYGREIAFFAARELSRYKFNIYSGLAAGIDSAAHRGAIEGGGFTAAILGSGVDICYPRINIDIFNNMASSGCIISEFAPGTPPNAGNFPLRNRLISAMSDVLLVVEAREKSGSLITVDHALEQGKDVFAVPGRIHDPVSLGCNFLIKQGAEIFTGIKDILNCEIIKNKLNRISKDKNIINVDESTDYNNNDKFDYNNKSGIKKYLIEFISDIPVSINEIEKKLTNMDVLSCDISDIILDLLMEDLICEISSGMYIRKNL